MEATQRAEAIQRPTQFRKLNNYRTVEIKAEARSIEGEGKKLYLRGYPLLFNMPTTIRAWYGVYDEVISSSALDKTDLRDVYLLVGHDPNNVIGRAGVNVRLEVDETGLFFECELPNTQYARDWYNLIERGIVDGMSFAFDCDGDTWDYPTEQDAKEGKLPKRTINNITKLWEITITPFPAYYEASVVAKSDNRAEEQGEKTEQDGVEANDEAAKTARAELEQKLKELEAM
jgi:HK97 family phage prohead protease